MFVNCIVFWCDKKLLIRRFIKSSKKTYSYRLSNPAPGVRLRSIYGFFVSSPCLFPLSFFRPSALSLFLSSSPCLYFFFSFFFFFFSFSFSFLFLTLLFPLYSLFIYLSLLCLLFLFYFPFFSPFLRSPPGPGQTSPLMFPPPPDPLLSLFKDF